MSLTASGDGVARSQVVGIESSSESGRNGVTGIGGRVKLVKGLTSVVEEAVDDSSFGCDRDGDATGVPGRFEATLDDWDVGDSGVFVDDSGPVEHGDDSLVDVNLLSCGVSNGDEIPVSLADNDSGGRGGDFVTTGFGASSMRVVRRSVFMVVEVHATRGYAWSSRASTRFVPTAAHA